jgi:predicted TIM-barrel fold metal-dependent hydrolase
VRAFFIKHQDRVLFGSDPVLGWDVVDTVALPVEVLAKLYARNARRLIPGL